MVPWRAGSSCQGTPGRVRGSGPTLRAQAAAPAGRGLNGDSRKDHICWGISQQNPPRCCCPRGLPEPLPTTRMGASSASPGSSLLSVASPLLLGPFYFTQLHFCACLPSALLLLCHPGPCPRPPPRPPILLPGHRGLNLKVFLLFTCPSLHLLSPSCADGSLT